MPFVVKPIYSNTSLGDRIRKLRESLALSIEEAASRTHIQAAHLSAIEQEQWQFLPEEPSRTLLMKRYAQALGADETLLALLQKRLDTSEKPTLRPLETKTPFFTPHRMKLAGIMVLFLAILGYLTVQVHTLLSPPTLTLESPPDRFPTDIPTILVKGKTETVASVSINDQPIVKSPDGSFEYLISLEQGVNVITIEAAKRYSKPRLIYRSVIYEGEITKNPASISLINPSQTP
ncbi:MAG: helix-turn-helix domain-containing protein [bacterium]|nr:helix-turn-helix domain-containing protein [bacterium]